MTWPAIRRRHAALLLAGCAAAEPGLAVDGAPAIEQPRPFGHVVGDILTQRVPLASGRTLAPTALPGPQRLGAWIERRAARVERAADGRRWLVVDYQLVNAPQAPATVRLPAWRLAGDAAQPAVLVPAWPVAVSPITVPATPGAGTWQLRPDRPASRVATAPLRLRLLLAAGALVAWLAAWAGWLAWRHWHEARSLPFAAAARALDRLDDGHPSAWRALHEAFDRTAGEVLRASTLPRLFERAPRFEPLRDRIEAFYAQSAARFFGQAPERAGAAVASPRALCRELRRIERRSAA